MFLVEEKLCSYDIIISKLIKFNKTRDYVRKFPDPVKENMSLDNFKKPTIYNLVYLTMKIIMSIAGKLYPEHPRGLSLAILQSVEDS